VGNSGKAQKKKYNFWLLFSVFIVVIIIDVAVVVFVVYAAFQGKLRCEN